MSDKVSTSVTLSQKNKEYVDNEVNNRSAFINDLIEAHRQGKSDMNEAIARYRKQQLESELRTVETKREQILDELEYFEQQVSEEKARKEELLAEAREKLTDVPRREDNPAIQNWAEKIGITATQLIEELED